ncbi:Kinase superfamily protein isoform 1 [Hibiscus syriacus]|uniref:Kinase superfamily protein isoform 1 n=1 Tax=Hibiscus syriacus TaxID=106335 RepID=A0A6A3BZT8_HIBSY|nr:Kinase superfamily protein isoform 1 [Hibiscus syriacus]
MIVKTPLCKAGCETNDLPGCVGNYGGYLACCDAVIHFPITAFGIPVMGSRAFQNMVNTTAVEAAVRCLCKDGFVGDGFANGAGCIKSRIKEGQEAYGEECNNPKHSQRKLVFLLRFSSLRPYSYSSAYLLLRRPVKPGAFHLEQTHYHGTTSFRKACRTRLFTYRVLDKATRAFVDGQKLDKRYNSCWSPWGWFAYSCAEARLIGCCIESGYTVLVLYEYPANGTLEEHLQNSRGQKFGLDWYKRLSIAAGTAGIIAYLQYELSPPLFHHDLKSSGYIFLDVDFSVKVAGFALLSSGSRVRIYTTTTERPTKTMSMTSVCYCWR